MSPTAKKIIGITIWVALIVYFVFAVRYCSRRESEIRCQKLEIVVKDSLRLGFVTADVVEKVLADENIELIGVRLDSIRPVIVEQALKTHPYIRTARVYSSLSGKLNIEIEQRRPVVRIQAENGYRFYLSEDDRILPFQRHYFPDVPIVTGFPEFPFSRDFFGPVPAPDSLEKKSLENYHFLYNLINFVEFLKKDSFWGGQIVQINVLPGNEIELIPRVGHAVILLGDPENYREKLDKLFKFYRRGLAYEGWNEYSYLNIKFKDQVVCTK